LGKIKRLPVHVANQIAAGEVVERPASVVKELVENALDAGADRIDIRLHQGGKSLIEVRDNGEGLSREDLELAVMPHATSKIFEPEDLCSINTLGFRGEALASISSVSRLTIRSRHRQAEEAWELTVSFGRDLKVVPAGSPPGSSVLVQDLFLEIPARYKFLKRRQTELSRCLKVIRAFALCWPEVVFSVRNEKREIFRSKRAVSETDRLEPLFGTELTASMRKISGSGEGMEVEGFIAPPEEARLSSRHFYFFLNRRQVTSPVMWKAVHEALRGRLVRGNYPAGVLFIHIAPELVDVNVHPSKSEVRFHRPDQVYRMIYHSIKRALSCEFKAYGSEDGSEAIESALNDQACIREDFSSPDEENTPAGLKELLTQTPLPWQSPKDPEADTKGSGKTGSSLSWMPANTASGSNALAAREKTKTEYDHPKPSESVFQGPGQEGIRIIGQFRQSYILAEMQNRLLIFDQHAAHEALLFKRMSDEFEKEGRFAQEKLLFPHVMEVDPGMMQALDEASGTLREMGLEVALFGENQIAIRSVPYLIGGAGEPVKVAESIIRQLLENPVRTGTEALRKCISRLACSMAVKANQPLHREQMESLVTECMEEGVTNCPHGRPVMKEISMSELEKVFFRQ